MCPPFNDKLISFSNVYCIKRIYLNANSIILRLSFKQRKLANSCSIKAACNGKAAITDSFRINYSCIELVGVYINWIIQIGANYVSLFEKSKGQKLICEKRARYKSIWIRSRRLQNLVINCSYIGHGRTGTSMAFPEIEILHFPFQRKNHRIHMFTLKMCITANKSGSHPHLHRLHNFKLYFEISPLPPAPDCCGLKKGWINAR